MSRQRILILVAIGILLSIVIGGNIRDYNRQREAELNQIRQESEQLLQAKEKLENEKKKLETENKKLEKDLQAKRPQSKTTVRVASAKVVAPAEVRRLVAKYFPANQVENALAVMKCESGFNANAVNWGDARITGMPSCGLFQINAKQNWAWNDPEANVRRAHLMWSSRGWQPWSCAKKLGIR
jgi:hypothetical protein